MLKLECDVKSHNLLPLFVLLIIIIIISKSYIAHVSTNKVLKAVIQTERLLKVMNFHTQLCSTL